MKNKLRYHKWVDIAKHDRNPSQTFHRIRSKVEDAINDQILLLQAGFPEEKEEQLFRTEKVKDFVEALLKGSGSNVSISSKYQNLQRRSEIASMLAKIGLEFLVSQYSLLSKRTPCLGKTAIDELQRSVWICEDIVSQIKSEYVESIARNEKIEYLFDWNRVPGKDDRKLRDFIIQQMEMELGLPTSSEFGPPTISVQTRPRKDKNNKKLDFIIEYIDIYGPDYSDEGVEDHYTFHTIITIESESRGTLRIIDEAAHPPKEILRQELLVKQEKNALHILKKE
jgi:hypothetical protein